MKLLKILFAIGIIANSIFAATQVWGCGDDGKTDETSNVIATFTDDGTLTISGTGNMTDWNSFMPPWFPLYLSSSLTTVVIENGVTSIGDHAFIGCFDLISVTIGDDVTSIGNNVFHDCSNLTSIELSADNANYIFDNEVLFNKDKTILLVCIAGKTGEYSIPNSVTNIGNYAFSDCSGLTSITIPNGVTSIGNNAFRNCSGLTSVTIPNGVTSIGENAFFGCSGLMEITSLSTTPPTIQSNTFNKIYCVIYVPVGSASAYKSANYWKEKAITEIGSSLIWEIGLPNATDVKATLSDGTLTISGTGNMMNWAVNYPAPWYSFTSIKTLVIEDGVTSIGSDSFFGCSGLISVAIPNSVTSIKGGAFSDCNGLTEITNLNPAPQTIQSYTFTDVDKSIPLYVPTGSVDAYRNAEYWSEFTNIIGKDISTPINNINKPKDKPFFKSTIVSDKMEIALDNFRNIRFVVYDMTGNIVAEGNGRTWDLRNTAGRFVANGSYLVVVKAKDSKGVNYHYSAKIGVKR